MAIRKRHLSLELSADVLWFFASPHPAPWKGVAREQKRERELWACGLRESQAQHVVFILGVTGSSSLDSSPTLGWGLPG